MYGPGIIKINKIRSFWFISVFLLLSSCLNDAPHDNPLDPRGSSGASLQLSGEVFTFYQPHAKVPGAMLTLQPGNHVTLSDTDGYYGFSGLVAGTYRLTCSAQGYAFDSLEITLTENTKKDFYLDRLPYFNTITLSTHHVSRWFPVEDIYYLQIQSTVDDPDGIGDVKTVYYEIPEWGFSDTLQATINAGVFGRRVGVENLPVQNMQQLVGRAFDFYVEDDPGFKGTSPGHYVSRIIEETPVLLYPTGLETVADSTINFQWQKMIVPYGFTFTLELQQNNLGVFSIIEEINGISGEATSYLYQTPLAAGDYLWVIYMVDDFGNTSSSKEGAFRIP